MEHIDGKQYQCRSMICRHFICIFMLINAIMCGCHCEGFAMLNTLNAGVSYCLENQLLNISCLILFQYNTLWCLNMGCFRIQFQSQSSSGLYFNVSQTFIRCHSLEWMDCQPRLLLSGLVAVRALLVAVLHNDHSSFSTNMFIS